MGRRKTRDEYEVRVYFGYGYGDKLIATEYSLEDARKRKEEYAALASLPSVYVRIKKKRVRLTGE